MGDKVSWKSLVGLNGKSDVDDGSLSPVFIKNKWVILNKSTNSIVSDKKSTSDKEESHKITCTRTSGSSDGRQGKRLKLTEDENIIYSPTRFKRKSIKRKSFDFPLKSSSSTPATFSSSSPAHKKSKTDVNDYAGSPISSSSTFHRIKRNILYSTSDEKKSKSTSNIVNINDIYQSIIMMDEADKSKQQPSGKAIVKKISSDKQFTPVSSLNIKKPNVYKVSRKTSDLKTDISPKLSALDDSLNNFSCTEVEEVYNIRLNRSSKVLLGFEGILLSPVELSCNVPKLEVNTDLVSTLSSSKIPEGDHETVCSFKKSFNSPKVSDLNRTSPTYEKNFETANFRDIKDIQVNPGPSSSVLNVQPKVNLNIEDSVRFDALVAPLPRIIGKFELSEENLNHPEAVEDLGISTPKLDENVTSSRKNATNTDEALKIDEHFEIKKCLHEDEKRDQFCPTKEPYEETSPYKSHLCTTNFPNSEFLRDVDITGVIQVNRQDRRSLDPEGESTEGTDSSKTKVENLLQGILDKPSGVPIQRLLSTDFLDLKSTVVQFSTAGGAVVTASQESLDKAKALLQEVLNECDAEESIGKEEVHFETSPDSKIIVCGDAVKKAEGLFPDKGDESTSRSLFHDEENDIKESSNLKNSIESEIDCSENESKLPVAEIPLVCPNAPPSNSDSAENETIQGINVAALSSVSLRKLDECISHTSNGFTTKKPTEVTEHFASDNEKNEETTSKPNVESIPASADNINSSRIQSNKYYFASTSSSAVDTSSDMCSLDESSSQENDLAYNQSGFSEVDFSTENFIPNVGRGGKLSCFTPTNERVSPLFGTPLQNLKLNSNKKLLSLSSRSQGRRSSPVENLTPRVANLKILRTGPQRINKSENSNKFQENLRRTKYKEDIKSLECKYENSLQGTQLTPAEKPGRRCRKTRNSDKISKTAHETKVNTTRYNLRSAKKQQNQDTSPDIYENKAGSIVKSPNYDLKVNGTSFLSSAKGDSEMISDLSLKTVKNIFKENVENISPNKRGLKDALACNGLSFYTAKGEEVDMSQGSMEAVKIHFINELNHSGTRHDNSLPQPTSSAIDFTTCSSTPGHFEGKLSVRKSSEACRLNHETKETIETSHNFTLLSQDGVVSKEDFKIIQDNEKTSDISVLLPIDSNELPSNKSGESRAPSEIEKCLKTSHHVSPQNDCRECEMVNTCKIRVPLLERPHISSQRYEKEDDSDKVGHHFIVSDCKMTFSTASGKNVKVSEASLLKAEKIMKEEFSVTEMVSECGIFSDAVKLPSNDVYKNETNLGSHVFETEYIEKKEISSICNPASAPSVNDVPEKSAFTNFVEANRSETPYVIISGGNDEIRGFNVDDANNKDVILPKNVIKSPESDGSAVELLTAPNLSDSVEIINNSPDTSQKRKSSKLNRTLTSCMLDAISMVSSPKRKCKNSSEISSQKCIEKCVDQDLTETQTGLSDSFFNAAIILTNPDEQLRKVGNDYSGKNDIADNNFCHGVNPQFSSTAGNKVIVSEESKLLINNKIKDDVDSFNEQCSFVTKNVETSTSPEFLSSITENKGLDILDTVGSQSLVCYESVLADRGTCLMISNENLEKVKNKIENDVESIDRLTSEVVETPQNDAMFTTAGGKSVILSEESLLRAKNMFSDDLGYCESFPAVVKPICELDLPMISTAGRNLDRVSEGSLQNVISKLGEDLNIVENVSVSGNLGKPLFSTAGGNQVNISEESLRKVKNIFSDVGDSCVSKKPCVNLREPSFSTTGGNLGNASAECLKKGNTMVPESFSLAKPFENVGESSFSAALGNQVNISKECPQIAKNIISCVVDNEALHVSANPVSNIPVFSTANGKRLHVSEESLNKVRNIFGEDLNNMENVSVLPKTVAMSGQPSFSTDSGNQGNVSEESLKKVRNMFADDLGKFENSSASTKSLGTNLCPPLFSTAGGKRVNISEESMDKVKNIFGEDLNKEDSFSLLPKPVAMSGQPSFSTAGGNQVTVSEESLNKVRVMFSNELSNVEDASVSSIPIADSGQFLFSTAGGKKVTVSEEILHKIKDKFQDEVVSKVTPSAEPLPSAKITFSTASGSAVHVSEDSLKKVRNKFSSDDFEIKNSLPEIQTSARTSVDSFSSMFTTAGGNSVAVSEKSLQKVRNIFQDSSNPLPNETSEPCSLNIPAKPTLSSHSALSAPDGSHVSISEERFESIETCGSHSSIPCFSTAAGNKVEVSEESVLKVRNAFSNEFTVEESLRASHIENNMDFKVSFKTAGGSSLLISEETLRKVKNIFKDDFSDISSLKNTDTIGMTTSFSTGERGSVTISEESLGSARNQLVKEKVSRQVQSQDTIGVTEESLLRVKPIFNNEFSSKDTKKSPLERGFMFSTGLGNSVSVSDESLRKVQASHNELDQRISQKCNKESPRINASLECTQSFANHLFNEELNRLEKLVGSSKPNEVIYSPEIVELSSCETPVNCKNKSRSRPGNVNTCTNAPPKRLTYKSSQEAMVDVPSISVLTSPSSFTDRRHMKPLIAWEFEYDSDDDILAAAQTPKKILDSEPIEMNSEPLSVVISKSIDNPEERLVCDEMVVGVGMEDILEARRESRENQKRQISAKSTNRPSISRGLYLSLRSERALVKLTEEPFSQLRGRSYEELLEMGLSSDVINVTSKNAVDFKFDGTVYFKEECFSRNGHIDLGSDFVVILSDENKLGLEEISLTFLACPSVDPALISQAWIKNHYRWIVWKLASLERSFPEIISRRFLTPLNVLHQLKYRYDREIDSVQRSAFKKILEGDEPASRRFIACVADIRTVSSEELENRIELELTDGWYSCWTTLDPALADLTRRGRLRPGTKLVVHSAELLNSGDGSDPLELKESVRLRLHGNSCRRATWSGRLGFTRSPGPLPLSLGSVLSDGGLVGLLSAALIVRVYPLLFMSKDPNGKSVVRNSLAESQVAAELVKERTSKSEELYEKIFSEVEAKYKHGTAVKADLKNIEQITNPAVLYRLVSQESELHGSLSPEQLSMVKKYHEDITAKIQGEVKSALEEELKDLLPQRQVTSLLKMRIMDPETEASAMVTIWRPTEELTSLLTENSCIDFFALNACGTRDKVLQLSNTKQSRYRASEQKRCRGGEMGGWRRQFSRRLTPISELSPRATAHQPPPPAVLPWGELDTAGVVVHVKRPDKPWGVTSVYLADLSHNFLMITFWTSLKVFGCEELLKEGTIVAAVNLHWRQGSGSYLVPSTFANELTYFYSHPTQEYLASEVTKLRKHFSGEELLGEFVERRKTALLRLVKERGGGGSTLGSPSLISRRPGSLASPEIAKRLEKLQSYGPAPPLPTTPLISTPDVRKSFKSPKLNKTPVIHPQL